ncbi:MAG: F0F1 ATP synthase subunit delta [Candidatus Omnitrophica bacterium]|nr:F0F1 ATP synthase subunit delta [Candidatus Omnitrophota bacterium]
MDIGLMISVVVLIVIFGVVFMFFWRKFVFNTLASTTQRLEDLDQDSLRLREEAKKKLEEAEAAAAQLLNKAKEEALAMRKDIMQNANEEKERVLQKAKAQSEDIIQQGEKTRHMLITELEKRIELESIKKAAQLLESTLPKDIRQQIHSHLVKDLLSAGLGGLKNMSVPEDLKEAKVVSAFELDAKEKKELVRILKDLTGKDFNISEEKDINLISGFMVVIGNLVFDGTLQYKIREKAKELVSKQ